MDYCPWHFFRTSGDVRAKYSSILGNLDTVLPFAYGLSRPGCWAYPDMLEVGCAHGPGGDGDPGLTDAEERSHFGAWSIVSSPLTLSHDVTNSTVMDKVWPLIGNKEAIAVNQEWYGHSGSPFHTSKHFVALDDVDYSQVSRRATVEEISLMEKFHVPTFRYWHKAQSSDGTRSAVLLMNQRDVEVDLTLTFDDVPSLQPGGNTKVRDIWKRGDVGIYENYITVTLGPHDAAFLMLSK